MRPSNDQSSWKGFMSVASLLISCRRMPVRRRGCCVISAVERERSAARTAQRFVARAIRIVEILAPCDQQGDHCNHIDQWNEYDQANPATLAEIVQAPGHEGAVCPGAEPEDDSFCSFEKLDQRKDN